MNKTIAYSRALILSAALLAVSLLVHLAPSPASAAFGITSFEGLVADQNGASYTQAGGHPESASTTIEFPLIGPFQTDGQVRDAIVELPPGLIGNPGALAVECTQTELLETGPERMDMCPFDSQVGTARISANGFFTYDVNVYSMPAPPGAAARFGMKPASVPVYITAGVRSGGDYGVTVSGSDIATVLAIQRITFRLWGVPADSSHDGERGFELEHGTAGTNECAALAAEGQPCDNPSSLPPVAFLTNPTNCAAGPLTTTVRADEWAAPSVFHQASFTEDSNGNPTAVEGCEGVPFDPDGSFQPTTTQADAPSGLDVELSMPTDGLFDPDGLAQAHLKRVRVTMPEGMSVNPASAAGLGVCTQAQIGLLGTGFASPALVRFTPEPAACPASSKVGTVEVQTPLLDHPLTGAAYLGAPDDPAAPGAENPFGSLLSLYLAVDDPRTGTVLKLPGRVDLDPSSGRLVATFDDNPQLPFSSLSVHLKQGPRAPLITPPSCGRHEIVAEFTPWSAADPDNPTPGEVVTRRSAFEITTGPGGGPCPGATQFDGGFTAGTVTPIAGSFSPLVVEATRPDGSQPLRGLTLDLPEGLIGKLAGIPYCSEGALAAAATRPGRDELASPSCASASQVGTVDVAAGAGSIPFHVGGKAYLAGPYRGAPLSVAVVTPAVAGPFDLGTVVVRAKADVDPSTAQIRVTSDPIPTILKGIPLKVRSVSVEADRPQFTLNPTNCEPTSFGGSLLGAATTLPVASRFQVGACRALEFGPKLRLSLRGSLKRTGNPSLNAVLTQPRGQANVDRVSVVLPRTIQIDNAHINNPCTRAQFSAGACPAKSVLGTARAVSPLLDQPLSGPVYFRANGGERTLPDIVADLGGQIRIVLVGHVDAVVKGGSSRIRTTFPLVPDAPVSKFTMNLFGGKRGLLVNNSNLCNSSRGTAIRMKAQNGRALALGGTLRTRCG